MAKTLEVPDILPYPEILDVDKIKQQLNGRLSYIIESYDIDGIAVVLKIADEHVTVRFGDFSGNKLEPTNNLVDDFGSQYLHTFVSFMKVAHINQGLFYITKDMKLVDFRISINKFAGPGYIRDFFSKIIDVQKVYKIELFDDNLLESLRQHNNNYIVKPSVYKNTNIDGEIFPMYGKI